MHENKFKFNGKIDRFILSEIFFKRWRVRIIHTGKKKTPPGCQKREVWEY